MKKYQYGSFNQNLVMIYIIVRYKGLNYDENKQIYGTIVSTDT